MEEVKVGYVHVPINFNAYTRKKEENTIIEKEPKINNTEEFLIVEGILLTIVIICSICLFALNKLIKE